MALIVDMGLPGQHHEMAPKQIPGTTIIPTIHYQQRINNTMAIAMNQPLSDVSDVYLVSYPFSIY
jgi:hypothetical protein